MAILKFFKEYFDFNVMLLFLISVFFLYKDSKEYKQKGMQKEYKFCRFFIYLYTIVAIIGYVLYLNLEI
ncbi:MAG: hypothetical protein KatS3mg079_184 [Caloramator sp.]|nr:MAG: hypothetical protein KatS3mg079_184 [Caloramator sp.]